MMSGTTPSSGQPVRFDGFDELAAPASLPVRNSPLVVAIDGGAASGKTTVAIALALKYKLPIIDTGSFFRALALEALNDKNIDLTREVLSEGSRQRIIKLASSLALKFDITAEGELSVEMHKNDITKLLATEKVSRVASKHIAGIPEVRTILTNTIRACAAQGGIVTGRDCGTEMFPNADLKLYLSASPEARARRRLAQYRSITQDQVDETSPEFKTQVSLIAARDRLDAKRMVAAKDAVPMDTSAQTPESVLAQISELIAPKLVPSQPIDH